MPGAALDIFNDSGRNNWIRLQTLVGLRWVAIAGQSVAIVASVFVYDLSFNITFATLTIAASILANLLFSGLFTKDRRLSEHEASGMLALDLVQLGALLYLTGGLNNPFALLMLAPVTIAATVLQLRSTVFLGMISILIVSALAVWNQPLFGPERLRLELPSIYLFGFWLALVTGVVFLAIYARQVTTEIHVMRNALVATQLALVREQKLTDLGGVVAATAHELGTPLATIKLVSAELMEELRDNASLREDAALIRTQADRCKDILHSMGRAGKDDLHLRHALIETIVSEAAEPHVSRGKQVIQTLAPTPGQDQRQPTIARRPEIIHGLRNLVQNAVDFSASTVRITVSWSTSVIMVRIEDDGAGYPQSVLGRIGDPFVRRRRARQDARNRPGYDGMGMGLFIAKTLLERTGATLSFANQSGGTGPKGALVIVEWARADMERDVSGGLGDNQPFPA